MLTIFNIDIENQGTPELWHWGILPHLDIQHQTIFWITQTTIFASKGMVCRQCKVITLRSMLPGAVFAAYKQG